MPTILMKKTHEMRKSLVGQYDFLLLYDFIVFEIAMSMVNSHRSYKFDCSHSTSSGFVTSCSPAP